MSVRPTARPEPLSVCANSALPVPSRLNLMFARLAWNDSVLVQEEISRYVSWTGSQLRAHVGKGVEARAELGALIVGDGEGADGRTPAEELVEQQGEAVQLAIRNPSIDPRRDEVPGADLHLGVGGEQPHDHLHLLGDREHLAHRPPVVGQQHPRPLAIDGEDVGDQPRPPG